MESTDERLLRALLDGQGRVEAQIAAILAELREFKEYQVKYKRIWN